jgi:hypothetical protein
VSRYSDLPDTISSLAIWIRECAGEPLRQKGQFLTVVLADVLPKLARGTFTRADYAAILPAAWKAARAGPPAVSNA